jgi:hypothetical protein
MKTAAIYKETWYVWCAPDGTMQLSLIGPDLPSCLAIPKVLKGVQSIKEMKKQGFYIQKIEVTINPINDVDSVFIADTPKHWG